MENMPPSARVSIAAAAALASSCVSDAEPSRAQGATEGSYLPCAELVAARPVGLDEPLEEGFTARELAMSAAGTYEVPLRWRDKPEGSRQLFLTQHETNARLSLTPDVSTARRVTWRDVRSDSPCSDTLELSGMLTLRSDDGAFDEQLEVLLRGVPGAAHASATFSPEELRGAYDASFFAGKEPVIGIVARFERARGSTDSVTTGYAMLGDQKPPASGEQQGSALILEW